MEDRGGDAAASQPYSSTVQYLPNGATGDSYDVVYNGIASTNYNPLYWKDSSPELLNNWTAPLSNDTEAVLTFSDTLTVPAETTVDATYSITQYNGWTIDGVSVKTGSVTASYSNDVITVSATNSTGSEIDVAFTLDIDSTASGIPMCFAGWEYSGTVYMPGDVIPAGISALTAVWVNPYFLSLSSGFVKTGSDNAYSLQMPVVKSNAVDATVVPEIDAEGKIVGGEIVASGDYVVTKEMKTMYNAQYALSVSDYSKFYLVTKPLPSGSIRSVDPSRHVRLEFGAVSLNGDTIIDSVMINSSKHGTHGDGTGGHIMAEGHILIMGTGIDTTATNRDYCLQIFGGSASNVLTAPIFDDKPIVSRTLSADFTADIGTCVIIHSGAYSNVMAGSINKAMGNASQGKYISTYLVMKGGIITDTVAGGNGGKNSSYHYASPLNDPTEMEQGGTFVYILGGYMPGDIWQEKQLGNGSMPYQVFNIPGSTILEGAGSNASGQINGCSHVFLSDKASVFDAQAGPRTAAATVTCSFMEISGKTEVKHIACGTVTDGNNGGDKDCVKGVRIEVLDSPTIANIFGAGYDTYGEPKSAAMKSGNIVVNINGDPIIGGIYGGGYRGYVGTAGTKNVHIYININSGTIEQNVFGGGRGGVDKCNHKSDGALFNSGCPGDSTGKSYIYGTTEVNINGGTIKGSVYGGGESLPILSAYVHSGDSINFNVSRTEVAAVFGDSTVNVNGGAILGSVYAAGKGIDATKIDSSGHSTVYSSANVMLASDGTFIWVEWAKTTQPASTYRIDDGSLSKYEDFAKVTGTSTVNVTGGTITGGVYGGGGFGKSANAVANVSGGEVGAVYGGGYGTLDKDSVTGNSVANISAGTVRGNVYGGCAYGVTVGNSSSHISGTALIQGSVYGGGLGAAEHISVKGTTSVHVEDGTISGNVYGGCAYGITVGDSNVIINGGRVNGDVFTGGQGTVKKVSVRGKRNFSMVNGTIMGSVYGGSSLGDDSAEEGMTSDATIIIMSGSVSGSVYGGGYKGATYGCTYIYVGYTAVDTPSDGNNITIGNSIYGGGDVGELTAGTEPFTETMVRGGSHVYLNGNNNLVFSGTVSAAGNSCLTAGETSVDIINLNLSNPIESVQRAGTVTITSSQIRTSGKISGTGDNTKYSFYGIEHLNLKGGSTIHLYAPIGEIGEYSSLDNYGTPTKSSYPMNRINIFNGTMFEVRRTVAGEPVYGNVNGFTMLSIMTVENYYGAVTLGAKDSPGGFVVERNGTYTIADITNFENSKCWFIAGVLQVTTSSTLTYDSESGQYISDGGQYITVPTLSKETGLRFTGGFFTAEGALSELTDTDEPSSGYYSLKVGTNSKSDPDAIVLKDGAGMYIPNTYDSTCEVYIENRAEQPKLELTVRGHNDNLNSYLGYATIFLQEVVEVSSAGSNQPTYIVQNRIEVRVDMYTEGTTDSVGDRDVVIQTVNGAGYADIILPSGLNDHVVYLDSVTTEVTKPLSVSTVKNNGGTTGWNSPLRNFDVTGGSTDRVRMQSLTGAFIATIRLSVSDFTEASGSVEYVFSIKKPNGDDYGTFTVTAAIQKHKPVEVLFIDGDAGMEYRYTFDYGQTITESDCPSTMDNFVGWFTDEEFNNAFNFNTPLTSNLTLYADYEYEVTFDYMNGNSSKMYVKNAGTTIRPPSKMSWDGYSFVGWYKDSTYNEVWDFDTDTVTQNVTLYAKWAGQPYYVKFMYNDTVLVDEHGDPFIIYVNYGSKYGSGIDEATDLVKDIVTEFKFVRWHTTGETSVGIYSDTVCVPPSDVRKDENDRFYFILSAEFTSTAINIILDANAPGDLTAKISAPVDFYLYEVEGNYTFESNDATRTGYRIIGWTFDAAGTQIATEGGTWVFTRAEVESHITDDTMTLYAKWERIPYVVTVVQPVAGTITAYVGDTPYTSEFTVNYGQVVNLAYSSADGYKFLKWAVKGEADVNDDDASTTSMTVKGSCAIYVQLSSLKPVIINLLLDGGVSDEPAELEMYLSEDGESERNYLLNRVSVELVDGKYYGIYKVSSKLGLFHICILDNGVLRSIGTINVVDLDENEKIVSAVTITSTVTGASVTGLPGYAKPGDTVSFGIPENYRIDGKLSITVNGATTQLDANEFTLPAAVTSGAVLSGSLVLVDRTVSLNPVEGFTYKIDGVAVTEFTVTHGSAIGSFPVIYDSEGEIVGSEESQYRLIGWYYDPGFAVSSKASTTDIVTGDITLYPNIAERGDIQYTVYIYKMKIGGGYTDDPTETINPTAKDGMQTTYTPPVYEGFRLVTDPRAYTDFTASEDKVIILNYERLTASNPRIDLGDATASLEGWTFVQDAMGNYLTKDSIMYGETVTLPQVTKTGYTLTGWLIDGTPSHATSITVTEVTAGALHFPSVSATLEINVHTITLTTRFSKFSNDDITLVLEAEYGTRISEATGFEVPADTVQYTFRGWLLNGAEFDPSTHNMPDEDITLDASWATQTYTITYSATNAQISASGNGDTFVSGSELPYGQITVTVIFNDGYTYDSYTLVSTDPGADHGTLTNSGWHRYTLQFMVTGDTEIEFESKVLNFTVRYFINGVEHPELSQTQQEGTRVNLSTYSRVGYDFVGWCTDSACQGQPATVIPSITANQTFYAKSTPKEYTITFYSNGGSGSTPNLPMVYDTAADLPLNGFIRGDATFLGWSTAADAEVMYLDGQNVINISTEDIVLYAVWMVRTNHSGVYDAEEHEITAFAPGYTVYYSLTPLDEHNYDTGTTEPMSFKDVGGYTVYYYAKGDLIDDSGSLSAVITKAALTVTADDRNITYGDAVPVYTAAYDGFAGDETPAVLGGSLVFSCPYAQYGNVGEYTITPSGLTSSNYDIEFITGSLSVGQRTVGLDWSGTSVTYDGESHVPAATATNLVNGDECTVQVTGAKVHAGDYTATATSLSNANYKLPAAVETAFTIGKKEVTLEWSDLELTYNGQPQLPTLTVSGLVGADVCTATVTGAASAVGSHTATVQSLSNDDYKLPAVISQSFSIIGKQLTISGVGALSKIYDGTYAATISGTPALVGVLDGDDVVLVTTGAAAAFATKDAAEGITVTFSGYTISGADATGYILSQPASVTADISKRAVTFTSATAQKTYDGTALTATTDPVITGAGFADGEGVTFTVTGTRTLAGTSDNTFTFTPLDGTSADNYLFTSVYGKLTITSAAITDIVVNGYTGVYDTASHAPAQCSASTVAGQPLTWVFTKGGNTVQTVSLVSESGEYQYTVSAPNHMPVSGSFTVTITKATVSLPSVPSSVYNGSLQLASVSGEQFTVTRNEGGLDVGSYPVELSLKDPANYQWASGSDPVTVYFEITKAPSSAAVTPNTLFYTGSAQALVSLASVTGGSVEYSLDGTAWSSSVPTGTVVQSYVVYWKVTPDGNHLPSNGQVTASIQTADSSAVLTPNALTYNGSEQTLAVLESSVGATEVQFSLDGVQYSTQMPAGTDAGDYTVYWKVIPDANHNASSGSIAVTIAKAKYDMTGISFVSHVFKYDEQEHVLTISGVLPQGVTVTYRDNSRTVLGTQKAYADFHGDMDNYEQFYAHGNYLSANLTISNMTIPYEAEGVSATYDGLEHRITVTTSVQGATIYYSLTQGGPWSTQNPGVIDVGTQYVYFKLVCEGYDDQLGDMAVRISARPITLESPTASKTYDGTALTSTVVTRTAGTLVEGHTMVASAIGTITDYTAGGVENTITCVIYDAQHNDVTSNYGITQVPGKLSILPKAVTIVLDPTTRTYDGSAQESDYHVEGLVGADAMTVVMAYDGAHTIVGEYNVSVSSFSFTTGNAANYQVNTSSVTVLTINPCRVASPAQDLHPYVFNGTAQTYRIDPTEEYSVSGNVQTDAGSYDVTVTLNDTHNYVWNGSGTADPLTYTFVIAPKAATITSDSDTKVFDGTPLTAHGFTAGGLVAGDAVSCTYTGAQTAAGSSSNAFDYTFTTGKATNYDITKVAGMLTVTRASLSITVNSLETVYDGTPKTTTVDIVGLVAGDEIDVTLKYAGSVEAVRNAGTYAVTFNYTFSAGQATNYNITSVNGTLTINKAPVTIPSIAHKVYTGAKQTADVPSSLLYTVTENEGGTDAGTYDVVLSLNDAANYQWGSTGESGDRTLAFVIDAADNVFTTQPSISGWVYGSTPSVPSAAARFGTVLYTYYDSEEHVVTISNASPAGTYTLKAYVPETANYHYLEQTVQFTISKFQAAIGWSETELTFNGSNQRPAATFTDAFGNVQELDSATVRKGGVIVDEYMHAGAYNVTVDISAYSANYTLTNNSTDYNINRLEITITWTAEMPAGMLFMGKKLMGAKAPLMAPRSVISYEYDGNTHLPVARFDDVTGQRHYLDVSVSGSDLGVKDVGTYDASAAVSGFEDDYNFNSTDSLTFYITPRVLTIEWTSESPYTYDGQQHGVTMEYGNVVEGEDVTVTLQNGSATDAGSYTATALLGGSDSGNYALPDNKTLAWVIEKANYDMSGITFTGAEIVYDGVQHTLRISGTLPTGADGIQLSVAYDGAGVQHVNDGTHTITANFSTTSPNYNVPASMQATIKILPKEVTVTANDKTITYGDEPSNSGFVYDGFAAGENESKVTGTVGFTYTYAKGDGIGTYAISPDVSGISADDYTFTPVDGVLTVSKKNLTLTAKPNTITYGDAPADNGYQYSGFVNGDTESVISGTVSYEHEYEIYDNVGSYYIRPVITALSAANYEITPVDGTLTVQQRPVEVSWSTDSLVYNGIAQAPVATVQTVNSDQCTVYVTGAAKDVGNYTATASSLSNANYRLTGTLTKQFAITPASLTVTANDKTIRYGDAPSNAGVSYDGFVGSDTSSVLGGALHVAYDYERYGDVGEYTITPSGLTSSNYSISFEEGTLTVENATITEIQVTGYSAAYDAAGHSATTSNTATTVNSQPLTWEFRKAGGEWASSVTVTAVADSGTYQYRVSAPNHETAGGEFTVTITVRVIDVPAVSDHTFDGNHYAPALAETATYEVVQNDGGTNAGDYTATLGLKDAVNDRWDGYEVGTIQVTLSYKILRAESSVTVSAVNPTYDGTPKNLVSHTEPVGGTLYFTIGSDPASQDIPQRTDAGTYTVNWEIVPDDNHTGLSGSVSVTIAKADSHASVVANSLTYSGSAQTLARVEGDVVGGDIEYSSDGETYTSAMPQGTNAGPYTVYWRIVPDANHNTSSGSTAVTIAKATYDMSGVSFVSRVFKHDGNEHVLTISGSLPQGVTVTYRDNARTDEGTQKAYADFAGDAVNYEPIPTYSADLVVSAMSIDHQASGYSGTYDGMGHSITVTTDVPGAVITYSLTQGGPWSEENPEYSAVGTLDVYYRIQCAGHDDENGLMKVKISGRPITLESQSASKTYDGNALTAAGVNITAGSLATGHTMEASATGTITNFTEGGVSNTIDCVIYDAGHNDVTANYSITKVQGTLTIQKKAVTISITEAGPFTYDATAKTFEYTVTGLVGTDAMTITLLYDGDHTHVGTYTVTIDPDHPFVTGLAANYTVDDSDTAQLEIVPQPVEVPASDGTRFIYNGSQQTYVIAASDLYTVTNNVKKDAGSYTVTVSLNDKTNYVWSTQTMVESTPVWQHVGTDDRTYQFTIERLAITISTGSQSKIYDATSLECRTASVTSGALPAGHAIDLEASTFASITDYGTAENTMTAVIKNGDVNETANFQITYSNGSISIQKRPITLSTQSASKVYDGTPLSVPVDMTGTLAGTDSLHTQALSFTDFTNGPRTNTITYYFESGSSSNYTVTTVPGTLNITKRTLTVTATEIEVIYGELPADFPYTYSGNVAGETPDFQGDITIDGRNVGTHDLSSTLVPVDNGKFKAANYTVVFDGEDKVTITKRPITVASDSGQKEYDKTPLTVQNVFLRHGTLAYDDQFTFTATGTITDVGTADNEFTITPVKGSLDNYEIETIYGELEVYQRTVTVTAETKSVNYGDPMASLTYTYSGNVSSEIPGFTGALVLSGSAVNVGDYDVEQGTLALADNGYFKASNYVMQFDGHLKYHITARPVTLTSQTLTVTYDGQSHTATQVAVSGKGFVGSEGFDYSQFPILTDAGSVSNTFMYNAKANTQLTNYAVTVVNGTLTVNKATITVTAVDKQIVYGEARPAFTYTYTGAAEGETPAFSGSLASDHDDAGVYDIVNQSLVLVDGEGFLAANYDLAYVEGTYTITKRQVTITSGTDVRDYNGSPLTAHSVTYGGTFAPGESVNIDYLASITDVGSVDNAFTYAFVAGKAANYEITAVFGTLTVQARTIMVTAVPVNKVFGTIGPELTYTQTGHAPSETPGFTGSLAVSSENVGTNDILVGTLALADNGSFKASNYIMQFVGQGRYVVTPLKVSLPAPAGSIVYTGSPITAYPDSEHYTVAGGTATNVGEYEASFTLNDLNNYVWEDTETAAVRTLSFEIIPNTFEPVYAVYSGTYDLNSHAAITVTDAKGSEVSFSTDGTNWSSESPSYTDAGSYTIYIKAEKAQYETYQTQVVCAIAKQQLTDEMVVYTSAYPFTGSLVELVHYETIDPSEYTFDGTLSATAAGSYEARMVANEINYTGYVTLSWAIYELTVDVPEYPLSQEYTGSEITFLESNDLYFVTNGKAVNVGTYTMTVELREPGIYRWSDTGDSEPRLLGYTIRQASFEIELRGYSGVYDGQYHDAVIIEDAAGGTIMFRQADGSWTNVMPQVRVVGDSGMFYVKGVKDNFADTQVYEVKAMVYPLPVAGPIVLIGVEYTGQPIDVVMPGDNNSVVVNGTNTDVGSYVAVVSLVDPENTVWVVDGTTAPLEVPYSIYQGPIPVTLVAYSGVYDGQYHDAFQIIHVEEGTVITYIVDGVESHEMPRFKASGFFTVDIIAEKEGFPTYRDQAVVVITPIVVDVPQVEEGLVYDGTPKTAIEPTDMYTVENGVNTYPGTYTATVTLRDMEGYVWADTRTSEPRSLTYTIGGIFVQYRPYTGAYDGQYHDIAVIDGAYGATLQYSSDMVSWSSEMPRVKDVTGSGTYFIKASKEGYSDVFYRVNVEISKASLTVTPDDLRISILDDVPELTFTVDGLQGQDTIADLDCVIAFVTDYVKGTSPVGKYRIYIDTALFDKNYDISWKEGIIVVEQHSVTVEWKYTEYTYTGYEQKVMVTVTDENGNIVDVDVIITDENGNPAVFLEEGRYIIRVVIPEGYAMNPEPGNTDTMEVEMVGNEAFHINDRLILTMAIVVTISAYLLFGVILRRRA